MRETDWELRYSLEAPIEVEPLNIRESRVVSIRDLRDGHRAAAFLLRRRGWRLLVWTAILSVAWWNTHGVISAACFIGSIALGVATIVTFERVRFHRIAAVAMPELDN